MNFLFKSLSCSLMSAVFLATATVLSAPSPASAQATPKNQSEDSSIEDTLIETLGGTDAERLAALDRLVKRGKLDIVPTLVMFLRVSGNYVPMAKAISKLTGTTINGWRDAMLWQEANPQIIPHESYRDMKIRFLASIDPNFQIFFDPKHTSREKAKIRIEEITWGGVSVDGIPSLDNPPLIDGKDADYLAANDLVFGAEINGDVRAYPLRVMGWHEMFNEVIGGVPVALAYCTLCGAGILFETQVEGEDQPYVFGSSGFLYRSNKLMFDRQTNTLWNQFTGEPVFGELASTDKKLKIRPVTITSWERWIEQHPDTKVLSLETGHNRDYGSGVVYNDYFSSPDLMFPTLVGNENDVKRKDFIFGIREFGAAKAWPVEAFRSKKIINDTVGATDVVLIGDATTRTVRAYERKGHSFEKGGTFTQLKSDGGEWKITEDFLIGPDGEKLPRVSGHIAYWFAWDGYLGIKSELYSG